MQGDVVCGDGYELWLGDCLEVLPTLEAGSVDLIATDPPYFKVKDEPWDNQWDSRDAFLSWLGRVADEWRRILKPNGSLYVFASPQMAWHVEGVIRERFNVLNSIRWQKPPFSTKAEMFNKEDMRSLFPASETIIFAEQGNGDEIADEIAGFTEAETALKRRIFGDYMAAELQRANVTNKKIAALFPSITGGLTGCVSNWIQGLNVPTPDQYETIRNYLNQNYNHGGNYLEHDYEDLRRDYEDLRRDYEDLRRDYEQLRRPFNATPDAPYTDVWTFPTVGNYPGKHPCEKPAELMRHVVNLSTRPGATVLDCFMGSGTTGAVAVPFGHKFIGVEMSRHWWKYAHRRIADAALAAAGKPKQLRGRTEDYDNLPLLMEAEPCLDADPGRQSESSIG